MNSRLDNAQERLESALARIDNALVGWESGGATAEKLKILTEEHVALRGQHREVSDRLDAAIDRLRRVLKD